MDRLRVAWSGTGLVGPGLTTFYFAGASANPGAVKTFFTSIAAMCYSGITWTIPNSGDVIDSETGNLTGAWSGSGGGTVTGSGATAYVQGAGLRVRWDTAGIFRGRRVRGSTYITSLVTGTFDASGVPQASTRSTLQTAASALVTAAGGNLVVWSRPVGGTAGEANAVTSASVPAALSWLRTRRT